jgi:azurin
MRFSRLSSILFIAACMAAPSYGQTPKAAAKTAPAKARKAVDSVRTVEIFGSDEMKYSVTRIVAKRGEQLRIRLISKGTLPKIAMAHNVVILKPGTNVAKFIDAGAAFRATDFIAPAMKASVLAQTRFAGPGETVEVLFKVPDQAGGYPYVCTFSGHFAAGMVGSIVVK